MQTADWLKASDESARGLLAVTERVSGSPDVLRLTPYFPNENCGCGAYFDVPHKYIASIEPTNSWCACGGLPRRVSFVSFASAGEFPVENFLTALQPAQAPGQRLYKPGTYWQRVSREGTAPEAQARYPGGFSPDEVLYETDLGFVLKSNQELKCEGTAAWRQSVVCGTVFLGSSRIEIENNGRGPNVGITGLCVNCSSVITLHPTVHTVYETWFWGTFVVVYNSFVSWSGRYDSQATVTMHH